MKKFGSIICSALLLLGLTVGSSAVANGAQPSMTVTFIDCDQGDSILVESNGHRMLVDGGKAVHAQAVEDCLRSKSISTLDYVVASHPDEDHIGGLPQIYNRFQVNYSYYSPYKTNTKCYKNYLSAIKSEPGSKAANPTANSRFQVGGTTVQVLSDGTGAENANDASLVLKVQCGNRSLLLTGDISSTVEQSLVNSGTDLQTDILKVAHHGSAGSSSASFLAEATVSGGVGQTFAALLEEKDGNARFFHKAVPDTFVKQASVDSQLRKFGLPRRRQTPWKCGSNPGTPRGRRPYWCGPPRCCPSGRPAGPHPYRRHRYRYKGTRPSAYPNWAS